MSTKLEQTRKALGEVRMVRARAALMLREADAAIERLEADLLALEEATALLGEGAGASLPERGRLAGLSAVDAALTGR